MKRIRIKKKTKIEQIQEIHNTLILDHEELDLHKSWWFCGCEMGRGLKTMQAGIDLLEKYEEGKIK